MRVASSQTSPIWLNKTATSLRVIDWLERAAKAQVDLVVFPEAFLSGYPFWVSRTNGARFEEPRQKQAYAMYLEGQLNWTVRVAEDHRDCCRPWHLHLLGCHRTRCRPRAGNRVLNTGGHRSHSRAG
jgi:predicted amidohydrolase